MKATSEVVKKLPTADAEVPAKDLPPITVSADKFTLTEHVNQSWTGMVPAGTKVADLHLRAAPFALVSNMLTRGDNLRLFAADDSVMFDLVCVAGTRSAFAMCAVITAIELPKIKETPVMPDGYVIRRAGRDDVQDGFLAVRNADGVVLNHGQIFHNYEDCRRYLVDHPTVRGTVPQSVFVVR